MKHKYDLIFSLGADCSCTSILRRHNLQFCSYPLDWLFGSDYKNRMDLIISGFKNFINKTDLEMAFENRSIKCIAYYNKFNDITFNHDFLKDLDFDTAYDLVKEKYDRRIKRLLENIENAKSILIVYIETPSTKHHEEDNKDVIEAIDMFKNKYKDKKIDAYYIVNNLNVEKIQEEKISENITKFVLNYKEPDENIDYKVDMEKLDIIFKNIRLNKSRFIIFKKYFNKYWINLIPSKNVRKKLRKKYHV